MVENYFISVSEVEIDFYFSVEVGINCILCGGRKWLVFSVWIEIHSDFGS